MFRSREFIIECEDIFLSPFFSNRILFFVVVVVKDIGILVVFLFILFLFLSFYVQQASTQNSRSSKNLYSKTKLSRLRVCHRS